MVQEVERPRSLHDARDVVGRELPALAAPRELRGAVPWDEGDDVLRMFIAAAAKRGMSVRHLEGERPRPVGEDDLFTHWSADLALLEVTERA